jgi:hypothetical protein
MAMAMVTGMVAMIGMIMGPGGLTVGAMGMAMIGMIMGPGIGMIVGPGGLTVVAMGMVGIRVTERMSPQGMAITLTPTSATPQGTAGIHAPIITMAISASAAEVGVQYGESAGRISLAQAHFVERLARGERYISR